MSTSVRALARNLAADGHLGSRDVHAIGLAVIDGRGVTAREAADLERIAEEHADDFTPRGAREFQNLLSGVEHGYSPSRGVSLPGMNATSLRALLARGVETARVDVSAPLIEHQTQMPGHGSPGPKDVRFDRVGNDVTMRVDGRVLTLNRERFGATYEHLGPNLRQSTSMSIDRARGVLRFVEEREFHAVGTGVTASPGWPSSTTSVVWNDKARLVWEVALSDAQMSALVG